MLILASIFRDSADYITRYFDQIDGLRHQMDVRLVVCEGDSTDDTYELLAEEMTDQDTLLTYDHGGPKYDSEDIEDRWRRIALVCNHVLDHLYAKPEDKVIYVESDLIWPWDTMVRLSKDLDTVGAVAAMSMHGLSGRFYDTWGHRGIDGARFQYAPPYHPSLQYVLPGELVLISSAGSCVAFTGDLAPRLRFGEFDCIVGLGRSIREQTPLWLDTGAEVIHPA